MSRTHTLVGGVAGVLASALLFGAAQAAEAPARTATLSGSPTPTNALLRSYQLYVDPSSAAARQVAAWKKSRPQDAALLEREVASQPTGVWIGDWNRNVREDVSRIMGDAARQRALPLLVAYNIPQRDCGSHSAGGAKNAAAYRSWISDFAKGLGKRPAIVVLEPDALASTKCLNDAARAERFSLLKYAVEVLKAENAFVYIDAGHANWLSAADAASRLLQAGINAADGFALNVSNFVANAPSIRYGDDVSRRVGGKGYVIDSSRNGAGSSGEWCNPSGRALGTRPTTFTAHDRLDAFLWVKKPGESDGRCNGGPQAGQFWSDYALSLAQRSTPMMAMADAVRR